MVRIYCQYSYGGFKNFPIEGTENELLYKEVSNENSFSFPIDANVFFSYGGIKMLYRQLENGEYTLVVKEIPSAHIDGDGRPIICAVQFIGGEEDRLTLDNMAISIANDLNSFETFFKDLFFEHNGLRLEGDKLRAYINGLNTDYVFSGKSKLLNIQNSNARIILLVALSSNFGIDNSVTEKVINELKLGQETKRGETIIMTYQHLLNQQNSLIICKKEEDKKSTTSKLSVSSTLSAPANEEILSLKNSCAMLDDKQVELTRQFSTLLSQYSNTQREVAEIKKHIKIVACGFTLLLLLELISLIF